MTAIGETMPGVGAAAGLLDRPGDDGAGHPLIEASAACAERADAHDAVGAILDQVDGTVGDAEIDLDLRMAIEESRQRRRDDQAADPPGHVDPEPARRFGGGMEEQGLSFLDVGNDAQAPFVERRAIMRR